MDSIMRSYQQEQQEEEACLDALLFINSHVFPSVLHAAIELDIFGIIAKSGSGAHVSASEVASHLPTKNPEASSMIDRVLRLFASHSLLSSSLRNLDDGRVERLYGLTPACKFFLGNQKQGSVSPFSALTTHPASVEAWLHVKDGILEGGNIFKKVHGVSAFEYMKKDPTFNNIFNEAIAGVSTIIMNGVLETYKGFEGVTTLVDVGGGTGKVLHMIISKYPSIKGINFDLPHVTQSAQPIPGIQHVGGDMLRSIPIGDAIMIKNICHNWDDEVAMEVLKNIYQALPRNGKLIIIDEILPEAAEASKTSQYLSGIDITMLMQPGGKERTAKEFEFLTNAAGFSNFHVACVATRICAVMESYK